MDLPRIPVQPVGWDAAKEILSRMTGAPVPEGWQGALPFTYRVDGGPSLKRIRPAPMGRAFRVQKRMCHVTLGLVETGDGRPAGHAARPAAKAEAAVPAGKEAGAAAAPARTPRKQAAHARPSGKESAGGSRPAKSKARMPGSGSKRGGGG